MQRFCGEALSGAGDPGAAPCSGRHRHPGQAAVLGDFRQAGVIGGEAKKSFVRSRNGCRCRAAAEDTIVWVVERGDVVLAPAVAARPSRGLGGTRDRYTSTTKKTAMARGAGARAHHRTGSYRRYATRLRLSCRWCFPPASRHARGKKSGGGTRTAPRHRCGDIHGPSRGIRLSGGARRVLR